MSSERRTALQGVVAAILAAAAAFGFITAEETQTYDVAAGASIGAVSSIVTAVNTWKQREDLAVGKAVQAAQAEQDNAASE